MPPQESPLLYRKSPAALKRKVLNDFAVRVRDQVAQGRRFTCLITDDSELLRLNRMFLGKDYATDVLSFPIAGEGDSLGEIAISAQRAAEQAREFGHTIEEEISILLLHGVLHLTGMDHVGDRGRMARAEKKWRERLELPAGLIERARK